MPPQKRVPQKNKLRRDRVSSEGSSVFLNLPYDSRFENLYLAYIAAVSAFGFAPRAAIEIPGGRRRLDRILELIASCSYSVHDLSRVEIDITAPRTPRFNMPFELGLAVALEKISGSSHSWFVCETKAYRLQKSLSDLNGTDPYIHQGRIDGLFGRMCSAFVRAERQPTVAQMKTIYRALRRKLPELIRDSGAGSAFEARVFKDLCVIAKAKADITVPRNASAE
jgi:hypothetical protein